MQQQVNHCLDFHDSAAGGSTVKGFMIIIVVVMVLIVAVGPFFPLGDG